MVATCPGELLINLQGRMGDLEAMARVGNIPLALRKSNTYYTITVYFTIKDNVFFPPLAFLVCIIYCLAERSSGHVTQRDGHGELSTCVLRPALASNVKFN